MEPGPQQMVIHFVQFLISEMKLPQDKIVEFAECNEVFPSPSLEKVNIYQVNIVDSFHINRSYNELQHYLQKFSFNIQIYTAMLHGIQFLLPLVTVSLIFCKIDTL